MVYRVETVVVTNKQVKEMKVAKMKILRFTMGVTKKKKIRNEYIKGTVKVERLGIKMREGRMRWYGHVIRRDVCTKKGDGNRVTGKEEKRKRGRPKRRFLDVVMENMGKVGAREKDIENKESWCERNIIRCGNP